MNFLAMFLSVTLGILVGGGSVLCIGSSGHVSLEKFGADCCSGARSSIETVAAATAFAGRRQADCGGCRDIRLLAATPTAQRGSDAADPSPAASTDIAVEHPAIPADLSGPAVSSDDRFLRSHLPHIFARTISLRC